MTEAQSITDSQTASFEERLKALVELVDDGYGKALVEQLVQRLEITVKEFLVEVEGLVEQLRRNAATQEELLDRIKQKELAEDQAKPASEKGPQEEIPEWERKLADLEESST